MQFMQREKASSFYALVARDESIKDLHMGKCEVGTTGVASESEGRKES